MIVTISKERNKLGAVVKRHPQLPAACTALLVLVTACTGVNAGPSHLQDQTLAAASPSSAAASASAPSGSSSAPASSATVEPSAAGPGVAAIENPNATPGVPTNEAYVAAAIEKVDGIAQQVFDQAGIPGMAVAVVHQGETVFSKGYGVREIDKPDAVDATTVFQLASMSKSIGATVVAAEVGKGTVAWDTPLVENLPEFLLSDPYVTQNVTIADMYSHRSGLPGHAGDVLEDMGFDQQTVLKGLEYLPLNPFRAVYNYTNFGLTAAGESVAAAAGTDWATMSQQDVYTPLGMTETSSKFSDFQASPNRAAGHVLVDGTYQATYVRDPDAQTPAGGVSSTVTDVANWLAMILNDGKAADGTQVAEPEALRAALTPVIRSGDGSPTPEQIDARAGFYGYGFDISNDSTGRVRIAHSGAFVTGAGTTFMVIPDLDLGIVVLTNAVVNGTGEAVTNSFADVAEFGSVQRDWLPIQHALFAGATAPSGQLLGQTAPVSPASAAPNAAYVGTYQNDFFGPMTVNDSAGQLVLTIGPNDQQFPLTHWDGQTFTMNPSVNNVDDGSISQVTFDITGDTASAVTVEYWDEQGQGTFRR